MNSLLIDVGQTEMRILGGSPTMRKISFGSRHLSIPGAATELATTLLGKIAESAEGHHSPRRLAISVTGFERSGAAQVADQLIAGTRADLVVVANDLITAHLAAHRQSFGITVIAGTGLTALSASPTGVRVLGGSGWLLGDVGGGYWLGASALQEALRHEDGTGCAASLHRMMVAKFGSARAALNTLYASESPVRHTAKLVPDVAKAAHQGDPVAQGLWQRATDEAAAMVESALGDFTATDTPPTVTFTGGLVNETELYCDPLKGAIRPYSDLRFDVAGASDGCAHLLHPHLTDPFVDHVVTRTAV